MDRPDRRQSHRRPVEPGRARDHLADPVRREDRDHDSEATAACTKRGGRRGRAHDQTVAHGRLPRPVAGSYRGGSAASASSTTHRSSRPPRDRDAVVPPDRGRVDLDADRRQQLVRHPQHRRAAEDPAEADHRCGRADAERPGCPARPGSGRSRPPDCSVPPGSDRLPSIASSTPGAGVAASIPTWTTASASGSACSRTQYSWKCTARRPDGSPGRRSTTWVSTRSSVIGTSRSRGSWASQRLHSAAVTSESGIAGIHQLGPDEVGGDVPVAEGEPERLDPVRPQLVQHAPGLAGPAPAALGVGAAAEGVHHGVEVGADPQPVQGDVVGGVDDDRDVGVGVGRADTGRETRPADTPGENHDLHRDSLFAVLTLLSRALAR